MTDDSRRAREATRRGEDLRAELLTLLDGDEAQTAEELHPQLEGARGVSVSEVVFQLDRLADERRAVAEEGRYRAVRPWE